MNRVQLARHVQQHLAALRAAGVEWLPAAPPAALGEPAGRAGDANTQGSGDTWTLVDSVTASPCPGVTDSATQELTVLAERVSQCPRCAELVATRRQTVFGVGPLAPELCFVGEAPGADEDAQGEPFVGPAGKLLNRIIAACGMKREEVYICNVLKCRPPGNRTPLPHEIGNCREYLEQQLSLIRPKFICALGAVAAQWLLTTTDSIGRLRGRFHEYQGIPVLCTYHPSYLLRLPEKKKDVWEDMKKLLARMGRPVPS